MTYNTLPADRELPDDTQLPLAATPIDIGETVVIWLDKVIPVNMPLAEGGLVALTSAEGGETIIVGKMNGNRIVSIITL